MLKFYLRLTQKNPVIVDEFTGKSRLILGSLANGLLAPDAPASLRGKNVIGIEMAAILGNAENQTQAESMLSTLLDEMDFDKGD